MASSGCIFVESRVTRDALLFSHTPSLLLPLLTFCMREYDHLLVHRRRVRRDPVLPCPMHTPRATLSPALNGPPFCEIP